MLTLINLKCDLAEEKYCSIIEADDLPYHIALVYQERILQNKKSMGPNN